MSLPTTSRVFALASRIIAAVCATTCVVWGIGSAACKTPHGETCASKIQCVAGINMAAGATRHAIHRIGNRNCCFCINCKETASISTIARREFPYLSPWNCKKCAVCCECHQPRVVANCFYPRNFFSALTNAVHRRGTRTLCVRMVDQASTSRCRAVCINEDAGQRCLRRRCLEGRNCHAQCCATYSYSEEVGVERGVKLLHSSHTLCGMTPNFMR